MRLAACLLLLGIVLCKFFCPPTYLDSKNGIVNFVPPEGGKVICEGQIGSVNSSKGRQRIVVDRLRCLEGEVLKPVIGKLRLTVAGAYWFVQRPGLDWGDIVRFQASIRRPRDFRNFGKTSFEDYCLSRGISAIGYVSGSSWLMKIGEQSNFIQRLIGGWRMSVERAAFKGLSGTPGFQMVKALVLGDRAGFDDGQIENFKILGIIHLLVVSGLHVAVLAGFGWWLVIFIGSLLSPIIGQRDMRPAAAVFSLILIWAFIALTGFGTPAVRAGLIATIYLGSILLKQNHDSWDSLSLAAIIILLINPWAAFDISFQLTFAAVAGIIACSKFLRISEDGAAWGAKLLYLITNMGVVSIGASLGVFPLLAYHFARVPVAGPLLSIVFSPVVTVAIVPLALVAALVTPFSLDAGAAIFGLLSGPTRLFMHLSAYLAANLGWSVIDFNLDRWAIFGLYGLLISIIYWGRLKYRWIALLIVGMYLGFGSIMIHTLENTEGKLAVTFLDVGQGASAVVRLPNGKVTLIDGGGIKGSTLDLGKSVLEPFLKNIGVDVVDRIIVTHPHPDHFKGLGYIAENFGPSVCMVGNYAGEGLNNSDMSEWNTFLGRIERAGVSIEQLKPAMWEEEGVIFHVFSPPEVIPEGWSANNTSGIIKIEFDDVSFLITGDIELAAESYVVENEFDLASTVLQVPHHGSATSSGALFLDEVSPTYGIIQVGAFNKYGFPEEDVLSRFEERGIKVYRTDQDGAVTFVTDGEQLKVFSAVTR